MTWIREISLAVFGFSFGIMVAGGVFTVLFVVGLIPRFAGRTDTARHEMFYEECIIADAVAVASVLHYNEYSVKEIKGVASKAKINIREV